MPRDYDEPVYINCRSSCVKDTGVTALRISQSPGTHTSKRKSKKFMQVCKMDRMDSAR